MVVRVASLFACCALLQSLACEPLYDIDNIACNGHGQCPTGYHCQQDGVGDTPAASGMLGVCVSGDREGSGQSAIVVSRIEQPRQGETFMFAGALFTDVASLDRIEEAVWEDVFGLNLLVEAESDGGVRHRAGDANHYQGYDPDGSARNRVPADGFALHIDSLEGLELPLQGASEGLSANQYPVSTMRCGVGNGAPISNFPQILLPGESWHANPGFSQDSTDPGVTGPSMPVMPEPSATLLVAGELLIPWGSDLQITDLAPDPVADTRDVFLITGPDLGQFNNPDCPETDCTDSSGDEDGDNLENCEDPDCFDSPECDDLPPPTAEALSADIAAYRPEGDGSIWRPWDQLPDAVQNGNQDSLRLVWGRTRRVTKYEPNHHVESTVLASTALFAVDARVLEPDQYAVQVIAQSGEPDVLQLELEQHQPSEPWAQGMLYEVAIRDRNEETNQAVVYQFASGGPSQELLLSPSGTIAGQVDLRPLCRGVATITVGRVGELQSAAEDQDCTDCGIGTFDYRRPRPVCDLFVQGSSANVGEEQSFQPSQVACGFFPPVATEDLPEGVPHGEHQYRFQASAWITYTFEVLASQLGGDSDTRLVLWNEDAEQSMVGALDGVHLAGSSDDYCDRDPRLMWQCQTSGSYILTVQEFSIGDRGYKLVTDIR